MNVVLPAPLCPTSARLWPLGMKRSMPRSAQRVLARIPEADVLEPHAPLVRAVGRRRCRRDLRCGPAAPRLLAGRDGQVLEEVRHVEVVLVHAADAGEDGLERLLALPEGGDVQDHLAEREPPRRGAERHGAIAAVERGGAEERQAVGPPGAADREGAVLPVERRRERLVPLEEHRPEPEELHLLGVVVVGEDVLQIVELARLGRAPVAQAERRARELEPRPPWRGSAASTSAMHREAAEARRAARRSPRSVISVLHERERLGHDRERAATRPRGARG